ncbi:UNVERIFIED_CONTAM: Peptidyl-prolyl cis-trans isomerase fkbp13, chloroplastic [Siphonaria sp. JEL0065]|nr:Peptidyl-prolyl cis-trans isomerase fkbp13, chloroplastic [Siphonaria sp. JEL0065]
MKLFSILIAAIASTVLADSADPEDPIYKVSPFEDLFIETMHEVPGCTRKTKVGDRISINYEGALVRPLLLANCINADQSQFLEGTKFDSTIDADKPFDFQLGESQAILGLEKGVLNMCVGERRKVIIASSLGYGENGLAGRVPPDADLIYYVELMDIYTESAAEGVEPKESKEEEKGSEL